MIEKLEDILHRERMKELQREIDELPDYYSEWNDSFNAMCDTLHSQDLKGGKVHHTQTAWKDKYIKPQSDIQIYKSRYNDLNNLKNAHIVWAIIQVLFCFTLLYICGASSLP